MIPKIDDMPQLLQYVKSVLSKSSYGEYGEMFEAFFLSEWQTKFLIVNELNPKEDDNELFIVFSPATGGGWYSFEMPLKTFTHHIFVILSTVDLPLSLSQQILHELHLLNTKPGSE